MNVNNKTQNRYLILSSFILLFFCSNPSFADWSTAGAQYMCSAENESFTLLPYENSSEGTPPVQKGFTVLPNGASNLNCKIGNRKLQASVGITPPQSHGMCMGGGAVSIESIVVNGVELLKHSSLFNWSCYKTDDGWIVKVLVRNNGSKIEYVKTTNSSSETNPNEVTENSISELIDVDAIAAKNAAIDNHPDALEEQQKTSALKLPPENDLATIFSSPYAIRNKIPLCAHWTSTFLNAITSPEQQRHGRIAGNKGDRIYIHKINPQLCPSTDLDCTVKSYLIPGDRVDVGFICGAWVNIQYESRIRNRPNISGWIETAQLYNVDPLQSAKPVASIPTKAEDIADPLLKAVFLRDSAKIESLIKSGANPDGLNKLGWPFAMAIDFKDLKLIQLLIKLGASVNLEDSNSKCRNVELSLDDEEIFNLLKKSGMDVNCQKKNDHQTTLMEIASYNRVWAWERIYDRAGSNKEKLRDPVVLMKRLLSAGANPNLQDISGHTALFYAMEANNVDLVDLLLESGVNPNISIDANPNVGSLAQQEGSTPLMAALNWYTLTFDSTMFEVLLSHGANPNYRNPSAYNKEWDETTSGAVTFAGQTVLTRAAQDGHLRVVKALLDHDADPTITREDGVSALTLARKNKHPKIAELIEEYLKNTKLKKE